VLRAIDGSNEREGIPDPSGIPPLCDEEDFAEVIAEMVADEAPRLFAIVAEYGERVDARCAAWGLTFADRTDVISVHGNKHFSVATPEDALRRFRIGTRVTPRLVWFNPDDRTGQN
jgi:hypothetical protein